MLGPQREHEQLNSCIFYVSARTEISEQIVTGLICQATRRLAVLKYEWLCVSTLTETSTAREFSNLSG